MAQWAPEMRAAFAEAGLCAYSEDGVVSSSLGSHRLLERMHREFEEEFSFFLGSAHFLHRIDTGLEFNRLAREALDDVVTCFRVKDMTERQAGGGQAGGGDDFSDGD